jgi:hypothetical protein
MPPDHYLSSSQEFEILEQRVTALEQSHTSLRAALRESMRMDPPPKHPPAAPVQPSTPQ